MIPSRRVDLKTGWQNWNNGWLPWIGHTLTEALDGSSCRALIFTWYRFRAVLSLYTIYPEKEQRRRRSAGASYAVERREATAGHE